MVYIVFGLWCFWHPYGSSCFIIPPFRLLFMVWWWSLLCFYHRFMSQCGYVTSWSFSYFFLYVNSPKKIPTKYVEMAIKYCVINIWAQKPSVYSTETFIIYYWAGFKYSSKTMTVIMISWLIYTPSKSFCILWTYSFIISIRTNPKTKHGSLKNWCHSEIVLSGFNHTASWF